MTPNCEPANTTTRDDTTMNDAPVEDKTPLPSDDEREVTPPARPLGMSTEDFEAQRASAHAEEYDSESSSGTTDSDSDSEYEHRSANDDVRVDVDDEVPCTKVRHPLFANVDKQACAFLAAFVTMRVTTCRLLYRLYKMQKGGESPPLSALQPERALEQRISTVNKMTREMLKRLGGCGRNKLPLHAIAPEFCNGLISEEDLIGVSTAYELCIKIADRKAQLFKAISEYCVKSRQAVTNLRIERVARYLERYVGDGNLTSDNDSAVDLCKLDAVTAKMVMHTEQEPMIDGTSIVLRMNFEFFLRAWMTVSIRVKKTGSKVPSPITSTKSSGKRIDISFGLGDDLEPRDLCELAGVGEIKPRTRRQVLPDKMVYAAAAKKPAPKTKVASKPKPATKPKRHTKRKSTKSSSNGVVRAQVSDTEPWYIKRSRKFVDVVKRARLIDAKAVRDLRTRVGESGVITDFDNLRAFAYLHSTIGGGATGRQGLLNICTSLNELVPPAPVPEEEVSTNVFNAYMWECYEQQVGPFEGVALELKDTILAELQSVAGLE